MNKITIIGHFGGGTNRLDGQTIKTKTLFSNLKQYTNWKIYIVDTYYLKNNPLRLILESAKYLIISKNIIVMLSVNGMRFYFPILYVLAKLFRKNVYHDVIGGNLAKYAREFKGFKKYLASFRYNWVETESIQNELISLGLTNCIVVPNFKNIVPLETFELVDHEGETFHFCTFSRVMKEKGIEDAVEAVNAINEKAGKVICLLDIFGEIDSGYKDRFLSLMSKQINAQYCGTVPFDHSIEAICGYDALLFPSYWKGEGFPGTFIDALSSGVPIIASDWNFNKEIVKDGITGLIYPGKYVENLKDAIRWLMDNREKLREMKRNCLGEAKYYNASTQIRRIIEMIEQT